MIPKTTIYATATPPGVSGVAVVRVSGPLTESVLKSILLAVPSPRVASLRKITNPSNSAIVDRGVVIWFPAPKSFTGEDVAELQVHGSVAIIDLLGAILQDLGCVPAEPGEFARRALENQKLDLLGVEALDAIICANDPATLKIAQGQAGSTRQAFFDRWRSDLLQLLSACEAFIDFPEDDLPDSLVSSNEQVLSRLLNQVDALIQRSEKAIQISNGLEILLLGPPNVGKSTLINAIAGYQKAIVTPTPGTTRDFVEFQAKVGSFGVTFVDTAGLRDASDEVEAVGIQRAKDRVGSAALVLNLYEVNTTPIDLKSDTPVWNVQTKCFNPARLSVAAGDHDQLGVHGLLEKIEAWLAESFGPILHELSFQRERQVFHVKQIGAALREAKQSSSLPELQAEHLRQAKTSLGKLTGQIHVEDVLDSLFSGFCIGK